MHSQTQKVVAAAVGLLALAAGAWAQCNTQWLPGLPTPLVTLGTNPGVVRSLVAYDPDGAGPLPEHLIAAGQFDNIEGTAARGVADWDGTRWTAPGQGTGALSLDAACMFNGQLVVGGQFSVGTGLVNIMRWDGTAWQPFGTGLNGRVRALTVFQGSLYAGGEFANAGGDFLADAIARWDGTQWRALGTGLSCSACASAFPVRAMAPIAGRLYVGGDFDLAGGMTSPDVAEWDGVDWHPLPGLGNPSGRVDAIVEHQGEIYAAGLGFTGSQTVARLNADTTWTILPSQGSGEMFTLASYGGGLYAGGNVAIFANTPSLPLPTRLARWDGTAWSAATDTASPLYVWSSGQVLTSAVYQGKLVLGGLTVGYNAAAVTSATLRSCLLTYDGSVWNTLAKGLDAPALDILRVGPDLVFAGAFRVAGGKRCNGVARWDGSAFQPMGNGLLSTQSSTSNELVADLQVLSDGTLVASGMFNASDTMPDTPSGGLAKWDGTRWRRFNTTGNPSGQMLDMAEFNGQLFLAGGGAAGGGTGVVRYNGTAWSGTGWNLGVPTCVEAFQGVLYANAYRWDGVGAYSLVPGFPQSIVKLREINGRFFGMAEIAWNTGSCVGELKNGAWVPIGSGMVSTLTQSVSGSINMYHDELIAARAFNMTGPPASQARVCRWNGFAWRPLTGDPDGLPPLESPSVPARASTTCVDGDTLWVSGVFLNAGGQPSPYLARYVASGTPDFTLQPDDAFACARGNAVFTAQSNFPGVEYRWRRNGVVLNDLTELPTSTRVSGAATPTLTILGPVPADSGVIDCVIASSCGSSVSRGVNLTVAAVCCEPDVSGDGNVDQEDVALLVAVVAGAPNPGFDPDFNHDGNVDQGDVADLVEVVAGGACP